MRLFIAINLPPDVRRSIWEAADPLRCEGAPIRWVRPDSIHLTLKFLGEVTAELEPSIRAAVDAAVNGNKVFVLPMDGFGVFPSPARPRVVWIGCEHLPALEILQHEVERAMESLGFALEVRAFRPHLTLGRAKRGARPADFRGLRNVLDRVDYATETLVQSVDVMETTLSPHGAQYAVRHSAALLR